MIGKWTGLPDRKDVPEGTSAPAELAASPRKVAIEDEPSRPIPATEPTKTLGARRRLEEEATTFMDRKVVGWIVVTGGKGRGEFFPLFTGKNKVGRGRDGNSVSLDFGDRGISRDAHFSITYYSKTRSFTIESGSEIIQPIYMKAGGQESVLLSGMPIPLGSLADIETSNTKLRFVPLCGADFDWNEAG